MTLTIWILIGVVLIIGFLCMNAANRTAKRRGWGAEELSDNMENEGRKAAARKIMRDLTGE
jgi:cytochrome c-type biogenesis protein CcmH/NrfF